MYYSTGWSRCSVFYRVLLENGQTESEEWQEVPLIDCPRRTRHNNSRCAAAAASACGGCAWWHALVRLDRGAASTGVDAEMRQLAALGLVAARLLWSLEPEYMASSC